MATATVEPTVPETVTIPGSVAIELLAMIAHFEERCLVLNGRQQTTETEELAGLMCERAEEVFGPGLRYLDADGVRTPIYAAIEARALEITARWAADIAGNVRGA